MLLNYMPSHHYFTITFPTSGGAGMYLILLVFRGNPHYYHYFLILVVVVVYRDRGSKGGVKR